MASLADKKKALDWSNRNAKGFQGILDVNQFLPVTGDIQSGIMAGQDLQKGNYNSAALNSLGLLPFIPALGGVVKSANELPIGLQTINIENLGSPASFNPNSLKYIESLKKELLSDKKMMPIELNTIGEIIDGAHRHKALLDLGIKHVPVYVGNQSGSSGKLLEPYNGIRIDLPI